MRQASLGLNRLRTRKDLVQENELSPEMAEEIFLRVIPAQHREDGTALYLEALVDQAISDAVLKKNRHSVASKESLLDRETPNVVATKDFLVEIRDIITKALVDGGHERQTSAASITPIPQKEWFAAEEAGVELNRKPSQIRELCRRKVFGQKDSGGKWWIHKKEIEAFRHGRIMIHGEVFK